MEAILKLRTNVKKLNYKFIVLKNYCPSYTASMVNIMF